MEHVLEHAGSPGSSPPPRLFRSVTLSTRPNPIRIHAVSRSLRETLVELCQTEDYDGFVQMALVQLDLIFEQDPAARTRLRMVEQILKEVDEMDWPKQPALSLHRTRLLNLEAVFRDNAELAIGDLPGKLRPQHGAGRATGSRPLPLIPRDSDPRATGSGPV